MPKPGPAFHVRSADRAKAPFLRNMSGDSLTRLFASLIAPNRMLTGAEKRLAEYLMDAASE